MHTESRSSNAMRKVVYEKVDVLSGSLDGGGKLGWRRDCCSRLFESLPWAEIYFLFHEVGNSGAVAVAQSVECAPQTWRPLAPITHIRKSGMLAIPALRMQSQIISLKQWALSPKVRDLVSEIKVDGSLGSTPETGLWPPHGHAHMYHVYPPPI